MVDNCLKNQKKPHKYVGLSKTILNESYYSTINLTITVLPSLPLKRHIYTPRASEAGRVICVSPFFTSNEEISLPSSEYI
jgi:hypothetical protein